MKFNSITPSTSSLGSSFELAAARARQDVGVGQKIGQRVEQFVTQVNDLQHNADQQASKLALGDVRSLHSVMIASEEAGLALSTVLQVRNKALEAYQEIMRMQV